MLIKDLCKLIAGKKVALREVAILMELERPLGPIEALGKRSRFRSGLGMNWVNGREPVLNWRCKRGTLLAGHEKVLPT